MIGLQPNGVDLIQLRSLVSGILAELGQLETDAFPLTERVVVNKGAACGIYFCLHGPRNVKLTAICDFKKRSIIYYSSTGERARRTPAPMKPVAA